MSNFKPNQKVVFKHSGMPQTDCANLPKEKETVTIKNIDVDPQYYVIREYQFDKDGDEQALHYSCLHPLISSPASKELISIPIVIEKVDTQIEKIEL